MRRKMFGVSEDQVQIPREPSIREINAAIPRKVRLDPDGGYVLLVFVLIFLGVAAIWFGASSYYHVQQWQHRGALNRDGRETFARITEIDSGRSTSVYYTFRSGDAVHHGHAYFPEGRYLDVHVGQQIPILFLPSDPSVNHPSGWVWWSWWDLVVQSLFTLFLFSVGVVGLGYLYRERRLACIGWVTEGEVIACAPKGKQFRVDYEFCAEDHARFDGANENCDEYETGSKIRVIYLRKNPKRNDTYPMSTYRTVGE